MATAEQWARMTPEEKARAREGQRKWRAANAERGRENSRKWAAANRERTRENARRHRARLLKTPEGRLQLNLLARKASAKRAGIPWTITLADLFTGNAPTHCPVLGLAFDYSGGKLSDASASVDRIIPERGYVPGNVALISQRANSIKADHDLPTLEARLAALEPGDATGSGVEDWELEQVVQYVRRHTEEQ